MMESLKNKIMNFLLPPTKSERDKFLETYFSHQLFSLPDSILYYITMKPSNAKGYQKLVQTCKYFFIKNPIIVMDKLFICNDSCTVYLNNHKFKYLKNTKSQLWVTDTFCVVYFVPDLKDMIYRFYRIDAKAVQFSNSIVSFNSVVFLFSNVEDLTVSWNAINNDPIISLEKHKNRKTKDFSVGSPISDVTINTIKQLLELPNFIKVKRFRIQYIYETFDIETFDIETFFTNIVKTNKQIKFFLHFSCTISRAYKNRLEAIIDKILATNDRDYKPPMIEFYGQNKEKLFTMQSVFKEC